LRFDDSMLKSSGFVFLWTCCSYSCLTSVPAKSFVREMTDWCFVVKDVFKMCRVECHIISHIHALCMFDVCLTDGRDIRSALHLWRHKVWNCSVLFFIVVRGIVQWHDSAVTWCLVTCLCASMASYNNCSITTVQTMRISLTACNALSFDDGLQYWSVCRERLSADKPDF